MAAEVGLQFEGSAPTFVHLSDIHFDKSTVSNNGANVNAREALFDDLAIGVAHLGAPAAVLVTGDIAFSGQPDQYDEARAFLERVTTTLKIEPSQVQVVPGNHDVDRSRVVGAVQAAHEKLRALSPLDADNELEGMYRDRTDPLFVPLEAYNNFALNYECYVSATSPFWEVPWDIGSHSKLRMRGLTTCIVSDGGDSRANLIVGTKQTSVASEARDDVVMVLGHHPTDWWHDMDECEDMMRNWVSLGLFGHKHVSRLSIVDDSIRITAGAVHPERHSDWIPRYNWLQAGLVDEDGLDPRLGINLWSRVMLPSNNIFQSESDEGPWTPRKLAVPLVRWAARRRHAAESEQTPEGPSSPSTDAVEPTISPAQTVEGDETEPSIAQTPITVELQEHQHHAAPPPLAERGPVITAEGQVDQVRIAVYAFGALDYADKMRLLTQFDLIHGDDEGLGMGELQMRAFGRLTDPARRTQFIEAINGAEAADDQSRPRPQSEDEGSNT